MPEAQVRQTWLASDKGDPAMNKPMNAARRAILRFAVLAAILIVMAAVASLAVAAPLPIESESVSAVTSSSATLEAHLTPGTGSGAFYFEYGTSEAYGQRVPAGSGVIVPPAQTASEQLEGLKPETPYYYRAVVTSEGKTVTGEPHLFTTQPTTAPLDGAGFPLPDERAWELVSPPEKYGARIEGLTREGGAIAAAQEGDAMTYVAEAPIENDPEGNPSLEFSQIISVRNPTGGWSSRDLATPRTGEPTGTHVGELDEYDAFDQSLSDGVLEPLGAPLLSPIATENNLFIRENLLALTGAQYTPLANNDNTPPETRYGNRAVEFIVSSANLQHIIVRSAAQLTATPKGSGFYEWSAGTLSPISILPNGEFLNQSEAKIGRHSTNVRNAVSEDGDLVVWEADKGGTPHLYVREVPQAHTVQIDLPQGVAEPSAPPEPEFVYATPNGERVYFKDGQQLTPDSTAQKEEPELYEYNTTTGVLEDLTPNPEGHSGASSDVQGEMIGASNNGEYVYFVAEGILAARNAEGEEPAAGVDNLYVVHIHDSDRPTTFVASLAIADEHDWEFQPGGEELEGVTSRVSPDGRYLAFMSELSLTGYDNIDIASDAADEEVFEYDAASQRIVCVSCNPTGERPHGVFDTEDSGEGLGLLVDRRRIWKNRWLAASVPGWTVRESGQSDYQSRYLLNSGRLFFDAADSLVPSDANGKEDVYEYEPSDVGGCIGGQAQDGGCIALISSGSSPRESAFLDASESGNDVFFLTAAPLVGDDTDTSYDVYDAHVCSASVPCAATSSVAVAACAGISSCQANPAGGSIGSESSLSASLQGPHDASVVAEASSTPVRTLTRAEKLESALKACAKKRRSKRKACDAVARKRYGSVPKPKTR
jgi:hypothetical protein